MTWLEFVDKHAEGMWMLAAIVLIALVHIVRAICERPQYEDDGEDE